LREYLKALGVRGTILTDDAHGAGVMGRTGRGALEFTGVSRQRVIQTITLSKAFGVYGGAVLCSRALREKMISRSAMFAGSTPLPLPLAQASLRSVELLRGNRSFLRRLDHNVQYLKRRLGLAPGPVPVIAIKPDNPTRAQELRRRLIAHKIFPSFIEYPGGPAGGYLRLVISSEHTKRQLDALAAAIRE
jgi:7-keto-8-aminopelargonate synthetase-like enzyme